MLPWLLVRIGTATSVEGKLEKTVVQESNSISEQNVMGTKLSHYSMEDSGFPSLKQFLKHLRKVVGEEGMAAVFLECAESPLATYHVEFVSSPWDTAYWP